MHVSKVEKFMMILENILQGYRRIIQVKEIPKLHGSAGVMAEGLSNTWI